MSKYCQFVIIVAIVKVLLEVVGVAVVVVVIVVEVAVAVVAAVALAAATATATKKWQLVNSCGISSLASSSPSYPLLGF